MRRLALVSVLMLAAIGGCHKQVAETPQPAPVTAAAPEPTAATVTTMKGKAVPKGSFDDLTSGAATTLAAFKGKPVLVNLWATWCAPCVRELPTLDKLAAARAADLTVVAISEDLEGKKVVPPYLAKHGLKTLHPYHDPNNGLMMELKEASLPVTILYDAAGKEVWRVTGDMDWSGAKARDLIAQAGA